MKPYCAASASSPSPSPWRSRSGTAYASGWKSTGALPCTGKDSGFLLLFLTPLLLLACVFVIGSYRIVTASQQRIAMQSRLDVCALTLIKKREALARSLTSGNQVIRATALAIYFSRGIRIFTGPVGMVLGGVSEQMLVRANRATAKWQDLELLRYQALEVAALRCGPTPFSREPAFCLIMPSLASATKREPAFMPDVAGPRTFLKPPLARADCRGKGARTTIRLDGDVSLTHAQFSDRYEK